MTERCSSLAMRNGKASDIKQPPTGPNSNTETRREPAPSLGSVGVVIPFDSALDGNAVHLPSLVTHPAAGQVLGQTRGEYPPGGPCGTNCADARLRTPRATR